MADYEEARAKAGDELLHWIESHLKELILVQDDDHIKLPNVSDFVLGIAVTDATDGPGEGRTYFGRLSSGNSHYRTYGLLQYIRNSYGPTFDEDD